MILICSGEVKTSGIAGWGSIWGLVRCGAVTGTPFPTLIIFSVVMRGIDERDPVEAVIDILAVRP